MLSACEAWKKFRELSVKNNNTRLQAEMELSGTVLSAYDNAKANRSPQRKTKESKSSKGKMQ